jgi:competence protein ComEA
MDSGNLSWVSIRDRIIYWVRFVGPRRLVAGVIAVFAVGGLAYFIMRPSPAPFETGIARSRNAYTGTTSSFGGPSQVPALSAPSGDVTVQVVGAVRHPGVYKVPVNARVVDAVTAAGGATDVADLEAINLAQTIADAEQIYVPHKNSPSKHPNAPAPRLRPSRTSSASSAGPTSSSGTSSVVSTPTASSPLNLNTASAAQLDLLPGIGPSTAQAIVTYRTSKGPFSKVDDLLNVRGIGAGRLDAIRALIKVG